MEYWCPLLFSAGVLSSGYRREGHYAGMRAVEMKIQERRKRGRPKRRWLDRARGDIKEKTVGGGSVRPCYVEVYVIAHRPHIEWE